MMASRRGKDKVIKHFQLFLVICKYTQMKNIHGYALITTLLQKQIKTLQLEEGQSENQEYKP